MRYWFFILQVFLISFTCEHAKASYYESSRYDYDDYDNDSGYDSDYDSENERQYTRTLPNNRYKSYRKSNLSRHDDDTDYKINRKYTNYDDDDDFDDYAEDDDDQKETKKAVSSALESLSKLKEDYQITGYNIYKLLGKNSPVNNRFKKQIDKYFGINAELLDTLDLIINKKEYPSLYLVTKQTKRKKDKEDSDDQDDNTNDEHHEYNENDDNSSTNTESPGPDQLNPTQNEQQNPDPTAQPTDPNQPAQPTDPNQPEQAAASAPDNMATPPQPAAENAPGPAAEESEEDNSDENSDEDSDENSEETESEEQEAQSDDATPLITLDVNNQMPTTPMILTNDTNANMDSVVLSNDMLTNNLQPIHKNDSTLNTLLKMQLAKNAFVGDLDRYGTNAYAYPNRVNSDGSDNVNWDSDLIRSQDTIVANQNLSEQTANEEDTPTATKNRQAADDQSDEVTDSEDQQQNNTRTATTSDDSNDQDDDDDEDETEEDNPSVNQKSRASTQINSKQDETEPEDTEETTTKINSKQDETEEDDTEETTENTNEESSEDFEEKPPILPQAPTRPQQRMTAPVVQHQRSNQRPTVDDDDENLADTEQTDDLDADADANSDIDLEQNSDNDEDETDLAAAKPETHPAQTTSHAKQKQKKVSQDIQQFLNSTHEEIITNPSVEPLYLNASDHVTTSQNKSLDKQGNIPVVQIKKTYDQPSMILIPDYSDGKLHINHF